MAMSEESSRRELFAGLGLLGLVVIALVLGAVDVARNVNEIKPLVVGDVAPQFALRSPDGATVSLEQFRGKVVLLDFWATWCPPCMREMPELNALHNELNAKGFSVVGINREPEDVPKVREFLASKNITFPVGIDANGTGERYRILSLPTTVLVSREGKVERIFLGYTQPDVMRSAVMAALERTQ